MSMQEPVLSLIFIDFSRAEAMGFPTAVIYLITMFCFMPFPFIGWFDGKARLLHEDDPMIGTFPYHKVCQYAYCIVSC